jgi:hypothetical protein
MKISEELHLPATPDAVVAMYTDPAYAQARRQALKAVSADADVAGSVEATFTVSTRIEMSTDGVPDVAKALVGKSLTITEVQEWGKAAADGSRRGTMALDVAGTPARLDAALTLDADGDAASIVRITGDMVAKIPRLEKAALPYVSRVLRAEERAAATYLGS